LAILVACGLRRQEPVELNVSRSQQREDHWAIVDLIGKAAHIRTIPAPDWVKDLIEDWLGLAEISSGRILLGYVSVQTTERYLGCKQRIRNAFNDRIGIQLKRRTASDP
jgi:hypothetical protein